MATSGTSSFNYTRDQIIRSALRKVGAFQSGETPDAQSLNDAADALNLMIKEWNALGIHLWTESEGILFLQNTQVQYALGTGSTDHATATNPPNFVQTTLTVNAALNATSIQVASIANILANDNIGLVLDHGGMFFTTVNGTPSGSTVNLASALTDSSTAGNVVVDYTTPILRPLRILDARRFNLLSGIETPMIKLSRLDYRDLPNKNNIGTVTSYFYDPLGGANVAGLLYVWPAPSPVADAVKFTWMRSIQDFNNPGDTPDMPQEWLNAIIWNLAVELAPEYDLNPQSSRFVALKTQADQKLDRVQGFDREPESIYFGASLEYPQGRQ